MDLSILYNENKHKVTRNLPDYSLDEKRHEEFMRCIAAAREWTSKEASFPALMKLWSASLEKLENIQYISLKTFLKQLHKVSADIAQKLAGVDAPKYILINGPISKSNFWLWFFIYPKFSSLPIVSQPIETDEAVAYVYVDDCFYSGLQFGLYAKTHFNDTKDTIFLVVPYMSEMVATNILDRLHIDITRFCVFSNYTVILPSTYVGPEMRAEKALYERALLSASGQLRAKIAALGHFMELYNSLGEQVKTLVYFQHKMASNVSTIEYILLNGPCWNSSMVGSLVSNCDKEEKCPPAFYKDIIWTYQGKILDKRKTFERLM